MAKYFPENITQFICHQLCLAVAHDSLGVKEFTCCKNPGTLYKVREQTRPECSHGAASSFFTLPQACRGVHSGSVKCAKDWVRFRIVDCNIIIRIVERCYGQGGCSETLVDTAEPPTSNHLSHILGNKCGYMCFILIFSCLILNFINTLLVTCFNFHLFSKGLCGSSNEIFPISLRYLNTWSPAGGSLGRGSGGGVEGLRGVTLPKKSMSPGVGFEFQKTGAISSPSLLPIYG